MDVSMSQITQEEFRQRVKELGIEEPIPFPFIFEKTEEEPNPDDFPNNPDSYAPFLEIV